MEPATFVLADTAGNIAALLMEDGAHSVVIRKDIVRGEMKGYSVRYRTGDFRGADSFNAWVTESDVERLTGG